MVLIVGSSRHGVRLATQGRTINCKQIQWSCFSLKAFPSSSVKCSIITSPFSFFCPSNKARLTTIVPLQFNHLILNLVTISILSSKRHSDFYIPQRIMASSNHPSSVFEFVIDLNEMVIDSRDRDHDNTSRSIFTESFLDCPGDCTPVDMRHG